VRHHNADRIRISPCARAASNAMCHAMPIENDSTGPQSPHPSPGVQPARSEPRPRRRSAGPSALSRGRGLANAAPSDPRGGRGGRGDRETLKTGPRTANGLPLCTSAGSCHHLGVPAARGTSGVLWPCRDLCLGVSPVTAIPIQCPTETRVPNGVAAYCRHAGR